MNNYSKALLPRLLNITSVISVFRSNYDLSASEGIGESHPFHEFVYVENGDINILADDNVYALHSGCLIIYKPHSFHAVAASRDAVVNVLCFETDSPVMDNFLNNVIEIDEPLRERLSEIVSIGEALFAPAPRDKYIGGVIPRDDTNVFMLQGFANKLELFILKLYERDKLLSSSACHQKLNFQNRKSESFLALMEYLKKNVSKNLTLEDISCACSLSISGLHRLCKSQCGTSPIELFISIKLSEAKRLIAQSLLNFSEISDALGFSSVHYFSKLFKQKTGMTPSAYSKSIGR